MMWMKNSGGKPDAMFSLAVFSWVITTILLLGTVFQGKIQLGNISFTISSPDATLILGYLAATFSSYVIRRNKKDQINAQIRNGIIPGDD